MKEYIKLYSRYEHHYVNRNPSYRIIYQMYEHEIRNNQGVILRTKANLIALATKARLGAIVPSIEGKAADGQRNVDAVITFSESGLSATCWGSHLVCNFTWEGPEE